METTSHFAAVYGVCGASQNVFDNYFIMVIVVSSFYMSWQTGWSGSVVFKGIPRRHMVGWGFVWFLWPRRAIPGVWMHESPTEGILGCGP